MSVREIRGHLEGLYGINVSSDMISAVTDATLEEVAGWQNRPLDAVYLLVFFDAIRVKIRDQGFVRNKAIYIALGIERSSNRRSTRPPPFSSDESARAATRSLQPARTRGGMQRQGQGAYALRVRMKVSVAPL